MGIKTGTESCNIGGVGLMLAKDSLDLRCQNDWVPIATTPDGFLVCLNSRNESPDYEIVAMKTFQEWIMLGESFSDFCQKMGAEGSLE